MSINIDKNNDVSKPINVSDLGNSEKFEFKQVQVGSIFLKDNGDGKISLNDFNHTTDKLEEFVSQYADNATVWTKDTYNAIVNYLHKNKDQIKEDSINKAINTFQAKANDKSQIKHISTETREKLEKIRPTNLAQASRIGGVKPADISVLMVMLGK